MVKVSICTKKSVQLEVIANSYSLKHDVKLTLDQVAAQTLAACPLSAEGQFKPVMAAEMHLVPA